MPPALFQERRAPEARRVGARDPVPALALLLVRGPVQDLHPAQDLVQGRLVRELVPHLVRGPALAQDLVLHLVQVRDLDQGPKAGLIQARPAQAVRSDAAGSAAESDGRRTRYSVRERTSERLTGRGHRACLAALAPSQGRCTPQRPMPPEGGTVFSIPYWSPGQAAGDSSYRSMMTVASVRLTWICRPVT